ncbi:2-enoyl thioester reductase domain-containing protein [Verrucomicrobiaceae bacterium 5K15]|uniref:enoyl-[acyl-carrier-protein] reductase n=1 Tax=Oceaniferula flava TaxID=2800421 RepID=A0AAE2SE12_9BACT|nr:2-enoyl thioester reductase domain-containing protein [Oceaniferula flavus]MBK1855682.1 2-enoyl thioester reductase domain-containing protein [Oceaniferula flavus]MBM1136988.1 2-enoyl thioester reductase domain-containing protein [Oceaniferula flavus]
MIRSTYQSFGRANDVIELEEHIPYALTDGQIRVRMVAAPINPADINFIQGNYGIRPELPCTPGIEGAGEVLESRSDRFSEGDKVIFIRGVGSWSEEMVCPAENALKIPAETPMDQAAMLKVNPLTAWSMLTQFRNLPKNSWVIQNAANSGVGTCVIQIAKLLGLRTINLVRRKELVDGLMDLGADLVLLDNAESIAHVKEVTQDAPPALALNAVGGDSALRLMDALGERGTHVTYGAMSMKSLKVPNKFLIFKRIELHGYWMSEWIKEQEPGMVEGVYQQLAQWIVEGKIVQDIDSRYPLTDIQSALTRAQESRRNGKVLLEMS